MNRKNVCFKAYIYSNKQFVLIMKYILIIIIALNLLGTNGFGQIDIENKIISSLIKSQISSKTKQTIYNRKGEIKKIKVRKVPWILLVDETETNPFASINDSIEILKRRGLTYLDTICYKDYKLKNSTKIHIDSISVFKGLVKYVSKKDIQTNFENFDWTGYKRNPGFLLVKVSRPGLNLKQNKAFIYYSESFYGISGFGNYIILEKVNGKWIIIESILAWMT